MLPEVAESVCIMLNKIKTDDNAKRVKEMGIKLMHKLKKDQVDISTTMFKYFANIGVVEENLE